MAEYITFYDKSNNKIANTYEDFRLLIKDINISEATVKEDVEDIPGTSDILDYTEVFGDVQYNRRPITIELNGSKENQDEFLKIYSKVQNALHGKSVKMIFSEEPDFYYVGRVNVAEYNPYTSIRLITLNVSADPYKYELTSSSEDWLWDPFSFIDGIINECKDLDVNGELEVDIYGRRKHIIPLISCDNEISVTFNNVTYNLSPGVNEVLDIEILEGKNTLKFKGNGKVTIDYRGGSL